MSTRTREPLAVEVETDARALVALYAQYRDALSRMAAHPSAASTDATIEARETLDVAEEQFRRQHFPRRSEVMVSGYGVWVCSRTRSHLELVLDLSEEYTLPVPADEGEW